MSPMNPDPNTFRPTSEVWPPPPTNAPSPMEASPLEALANFQVQNVWLILLLSVVTLGIYPVYWLKRQMTTLNTLRPDLKLTAAVPNIVLVFAFLSFGLDVASWVSHSQSIDSAASGLDRIYGLMALFLSFQVRNGFNTLLQAQKGGPYWFSGLGTWLLGVVYLQHKINKDIERWQNESQATFAY